jgi:Tfp pilus assembly protein FimV
MLHAAEPVQASVQPNAGRSYTVQRGDTLDRVIQKTMAASPLKIELLRQAFVDGNPQAFVSGNVSRLRAGAVLQVPDHTKLLRAVVLPVLESADAAAMAGEGRSSNASDRRSWVRFP